MGVYVSFKLPLWAPNIYGPWNMEGKSDGAEVDPFGQGLNLCAGLKDS